MKTHTPTRGRPQPVAVKHYPLPTATVFKPSALTLMSHTQSAATSSSKFQLIINNALKAYEKRTKEDLVTHPLAAQLQTCRTPAAILPILQEQVQGLDKSQLGDERWSKWLDPTVNVLFAFSATIGAGASLVFLKPCYLSGICVLTFIWQVFSPSSVIFAGIGVLLSVRTLSVINARTRPVVTTYVSQAARDVRSSRNTLLDIFQRIEMFFRRLEVYTAVDPTPEMMDMMVQITVEVLSILGIATKEIKQGRTSE